MKEEPKNGRVDLPNGDYEHYQNGLLHGEECYTHPDGMVVVTQWRHGKPHGEGRTHHPDGTVSVMHWRDGKRIENA